MIHFWRVAGWLAALVLALLTTSMLLLGLWLHAARAGPGRPPLLASRHLSLEAPFRPGHPPVFVFKHVMPRRVNTRIFGSMVRGVVLEGLR